MRGLSSTRGGSRQGFSLALAALLARVSGPGAERACVGAAGVLALAVHTTGTLANARTTATNANAASAIVARDVSGNFSASTITAALSGNATTASTLQTARTINGVSFNGSANITVTANPNSHTHAAADINSGILNIARIPTGTTETTVAFGNHTHSDYVTTSGGITAIAVVSVMPGTPNPNTLYIVQ